MNSKKVILSTITVLILMIPPIVQTNFYTINDSTLWILKTESGDASIDVGLDEIKSSLQDILPDTRIRNFQSLDSLNIADDYIIVIGHGVPEGLEVNGKISPWDEVYAAIREANPERAFVLACYSPLDNEIVGFNAPIDAKSGAMLISWLIHDLLGSEKQINFCVEDIVTAQSEMRNPLGRYLYFVHGYFGNNSDFSSMVDRLQDDGISKLFRNKVF